MPDIRLQNPASMVAIITNWKRRRSIRAPRKRIAHDDEGGGEHQERDGGESLRRHALLQQSEAGRAFYQGLIAAGQRAREGKADAKGEQGIQRIRRHQKALPLHNANSGNCPCIAKLAGCRHTILKERLTAGGRNRPPDMARADATSREIVRKPACAWHICR